MRTFKIIDDFGAEDHEIGNPICSGCDRGYPISCCYCSGLVHGEQHYVEIDGATGSRIFTKCDFCELGVGNDE
jgi:hypothetical protein